MKCFFSAQTLNSEEFRHLQCIFTEASVTPKTIIRKQPLPWSIPAEHLRISTLS